MANTHILISTTTLSSTNSIIGFSSIPQIYTDLLILGSVKTSRTGANDFIKGYFNTDQTDANYSGYLNYGGNTGTATGVTFAGAGAPRYFGDVPADQSGDALSFSATKIYIPDYTSNQTKCWVAESAELAASTTQLITMSIGRWSGTAPITDINFVCGVTGPWKANSTFSLYGIKGSN